MGQDDRKRVAKRKRADEDDAGRNDDDQGDAKKQKLAVGFDPSTGKFNIDGRSAFNTGAKNIKVNQDRLKGAVEDRRHILHYDEVLKPAIERVVDGLYIACGKDRAKVAAKIRDALAKRGVKRLPQDDGKLFERLVTEVNSARDNLIPDRADTNKAIEVVRGYLRAYQKALATDEFAEDAYQGLTARMAQYTKLAHGIFVRDASGGDITVERNRIHGEILVFIDGCRSPAELWNTVHDLVHSVTFDFSPKITRDFTVKAIEWQRRMARNADEPADKQLEDLLSILA
jgi:hypothetical protein